MCCLNYGDLFEYLQFDFECFILIYLRSILDLFKHLQPDKDN